MILVCIDIISSKNSRYTINVSLCLYVGYTSQLEEIDSWLENPRTEWRFRAGNTDFYGAFSSTPCLIARVHEMDIVNEPNLTVLCSGERRALFELGYHGVSIFPIYSLFNREPAMGLGVSQSSVYIYIFIYDIFMVKYREHSTTRMWI